MYYGAANRDGGFQNLDKMDMHRNNVQDHLAFAPARMFAWASALPICSWKPLISVFLIASQMLNGPAISVAPNNFVNAISHLEVGAGHSIMHASGTARLKKWFKRLAFLLALPVLAIHFCHCLCERQNRHL